jgi:transcriptional regulator with XRE-family HTH domain
MTVNPSSNPVNIISLLDRKISSVGSGRLRAAMSRPKKKLTKRQIEDLTGLQKKMLEVVEKNEKAGLKRQHIFERSQERASRGIGRVVPVTTINSVSTGTVPSIKTLEGIALAYDEDPLEFFRVALDDPLDPDEFANSPIYRIWSLYKKIPEENRPAVDERIEDLIDYMRRKERS